MLNASHAIKKKSGAQRSLDKWCSDLSLPAKQKRLWGAFLLLTLGNGGHMSHSFSTWTPSHYHWKMVDYSLTAPCYATSSALPVYDHTIRAPQTVCSVSVHNKIQSSIIPEIGCGCTRKDPGEVNLSSESRQTC